MTRNFIEYKKKRFDTTIKHLRKQKGYNSMKINDNVSRTITDDHFKELTVLNKTNDHIEDEERNIYKK